MSNLGLMTRPDFALLDTFDNRWNSPDPAARYAEVTGVEYRAQFGGLLLAAERTPRDLRCADVTLLQGDWRDCTPPELGVVCPLAYNAAANPAPRDGQGAPQWTTRLRGGLLPANPHLLLTLVRTEAPPQGQPAETQRWQLGLGALTLTWGRFAAPVLAYGGNELARMAVQPGERELFAFSTHQRWEISAVDGCLHLACSGLAAAWTVPIGELPPVPWTFAANGGKYAVHVAPLTFARTGSLLTPWIEESAVYPAEDAIIRCFPPLPPGAATVEAAAVDGTRKRYRVTLHGDGASTPVLRAYEVRYEPQFAAPTDIWQETTPWLVRGREQLSEEPAARSSEFVLRADAAFANTFGALPGQCAVRYTTGYDDGAGNTAAQPRMVGILRRTNHDGVHLSATCYDRWTQLTDARLLFPPCLLGLSRAEAVTLLAARGGIPPESVVVAAEVVGQVGGDAADFSARSPAWLPRAGVSVADALRHLCAAYGIHAAFRPDGTLSCRTTDDTEPVAEVSSATGTDARYALGTDACYGVDMETDLTGAVNVQVTVGRSPCGDPLVATLCDAESIGNPAATPYLGYRAVAYREMPDLTTLPRVVESAARAWNDLPTGLPRVTLTSHTGYALCHCLPRQYIRVTDALLGGTRVCRVLRMSVELRLDRPPRTTLTLEVLPCE